MRYIWRISAVLDKQISHLPPDLKRQVRASLDEILKKPESGKMLSEELEGYRSYRIGRYRLVYKILEDRLVLEAVGPRRDIYERIILEIGRQKIKERAAKYQAARPRVKTRKAVGKGFPRRRSPK